MAMLSSPQISAAFLLEAPSASVLVLVIILLLVAGIMKLALILRRPGVNQLCVAALLLFVASWVVSISLSQLQSLLPLPAPINMGISFLSIMGMVGTVVLAVMGLVEGSRNPGKYRQGKAQGVWALVLSGCLVLGFVALAAVAGQKGFQNVLAKAREGKGGKSGDLALDGTEEFKEFNFRFGKPAQPWVRLPKGTVIPTATAVYSRALPEAYLGVIAEKNEVGLGHDDLQAVAEARIKSMASSVKELARETRILSGVTFLRVTFKVEGMQGVPIPVCYDEWVACTSQTAYQFIFWSPFSSREILTWSADSWMASFSLIEAAPDSARKGFFKDAEIPAEGYATRLEPLEWRESEPSSFESGDFAAHHGPDQMGLVVVPLPALDGIREQEIDDRMLEVLEVTARDKPQGPVEITHSGISGREYSFDRNVDEVPQHFRVRILRKDRMVWMLTTWAPKSQGLEGGEKAAEAVRLFVPPEGAPAAVLPPAAVKAKAVIINSLGIKLYKRQEYARSEVFFRAAAALSPSDEAIVGNLVDCFTERNLHQEALEALKEYAAKGSLTGSRKVLTRQAILLGQTGDVPGALAMWKELFASGYENEDHLLTWINLLLDHGDKEESLKALRDYAAAHPSARLTLWEAAVLGRLDKYDEAFKILDTLVSGGKPDPDALYLKGEFENESGRYEEAEKTATRLVAAGEDTPRTQMILGWSEWHRKSWKAARGAFEKAAEKAPNDPGIREALSMTRGALGQGTAEVSATPLDPVAIPESILKAMAGHPAPPEDLVKGHGAVQQERVTGCYYQAGKPARVTQYYKVKVLDTAGVEAFSTLGLTFYPASERVHVNKLIVRDESGATVQEGNNADAYTSGESGEIASGAQVLRVPVPGLRRGCTLEAVITVEDKSKSTRPPFRRDLLVSGFPTLARAWFFSGDTDALKVLGGPGLTTLNSSGVKGFAAFDLAAFRRESFSAPLEEWQPWVMAGPADGDWKTPSLDYLKRLTDRLKPDESTEKVFKEITKGLATPQQKLSAIARHVQSTLTYKGLEFGTRALIPSPVSKIQSDHYGDCKDHTLLLYHLLRRAGIKCHPALVDTGWKIRQDIASLDQFDHMILYVPDASPNPWIDATEDGFDLTRFFPSGLAGSEALVLDPERPRFERIPDAAATEIRIDRKVSSGGEQSVKVEEDLTLSGETASWARNWFLGSPRSEHPALVRRQWDGYGNVEISEVTLTAMEDVSQPFSVRLKYTVGDAVDPATRQVTLPFFWERDYLTVNPADDRRAPLEINPSMKVDSRTRLSPELAAALPSDSPASGAKTIGADWHLARESAAGEISLHLTVDSLQGKYPAARWTEFQQGRRALIDKLKRPVMTLPPQKVSVETAPKTER